MIIYLERQLEAAFGTSAEQNSCTRIQVAHQNLLQKEVIALTRTGR
jgi:hypothetical protein